MEIFGVGTEIIECVRLGKMIERHDERFLRRVFTNREIQYCSGSRLAMHQYALVWSAKQAVRKAIKIHKTRDVSWLDIEIRRQAKGESASDGVVFAAFGGAVRAWCAEQRIATIQIATSTCRNYATATAIALVNPTSPTP